LASIASEEKLIRNSDVNIQIRFEKCYVLVG